MESSRPAVEKTLPASMLEPSSRPLAIGSPEEPVRSWGLKLLPSVPEPSPTNSMIFLVLSTTTSGDSGEDGEEATFEGLSECLLTSILHPQDCILQCARRLKETICIMHVLNPCVQAQKNLYGGILGIPGTPSSSRSWTIRWKNTGAILGHACRDENVQLLSQLSCH